MSPRPRLPRDVQELVFWYERYISPLSLIAGFLADNFILLRRVDLWTSNLLLFFYLVLAGVGIIVINMLETGRMRDAIMLRIAPLVPVAVQFAFGGLFSAFLSLYSRSAAYAVSWIFVIILGATLISNERFTRLYTRITFQISVYFAVLFSFLIFYIPLVVKQIGPYMFLASGIVALLCIALFSVTLGVLVPERVVPEQTKLARAIAIIFILFSALYFSGAIPPLPLALKESGVYHGVSRIGSDYHLLSEPRAWYQAFLNYNTTLHLAPGESAYVFSSMFAPEGLSTTMLHQWQRYDDSTGAWVTDETVSFPIVGGRDGGYRGYSFDSGVAPGRWRVNVLTGYGQIVGRISFTVEAVTEKPILEEIVE